MVGTSTGIEPYFAFSYWRSGRLGTIEIKEKIIQEYLDENNLIEDSELPDYFVAANTISPKDHIYVQATIQKWLDSSISKTANLPQETSVDDVKKLYSLAYELGVKGSTLYRGGSRDSQVLSTDDGDQKEPTVAKNAANQKFTVRPNVVQGKTEKIHMPDGKLYITTNFTNEDGIVEVFVHGGEGNSEINALCNYVGRLISVMRKYNVPLKSIVGQGAKVPGGSPFWYKGDLDNKGRLIGNIPSAISHVLGRFLDDNTKREVRSGVKCPSCGGILREEENCYNCPSCGYSKCS